MDIPDSILVDRRVSTQTMTEEIRTDDPEDATQNSSDDAETETSAMITRRGALTVLGATGLLGYLGTG